MKGTNTLSIEEPPKRAMKSVEKDNKIGELKSRFDQISLEEYIRGISAHTAILTFPFHFHIILVFLLI